MVDFASRAALGSSADAIGSTVAKVAKVQGFASGGAIYGSGSSTRDKVPIMASPGEHMFDASDVAAMGRQAGVDAFREALHAPKCQMSSYGSYQSSNGGAGPMLLEVSFTGKSTGGAISLMDTRVEVKVNGMTREAAVRGPSDHCQAGLQIDRR